MHEFEPDPIGAEFNLPRACRICGDPLNGPLHRRPKGWEDPGRKDDTGKIRIELFPPEALVNISKVLTFGAQKYGDRNWEKGITWSRVYGAAMRHAWAWWGGEQVDPETGMSHLWHMGCCVAFLIAFEERGAGTDDRPKISDFELGVAPIETGSGDRCDRCGAPATMKVHGETLCTPCCLNPVYPADPS